MPGLHAVLGRILLAACVAAGGRPVGGGRRGPHAGHGRRRLCLGAGGPAGPRGVFAPAS